MFFIHLWRGGCWKWRPIVEIGSQVSSGLLNGIYRMWLIRLYLQTKVCISIPGVNKVAFTQWHPLHCRISGCNGWITWARPDWLDWGLALQACLFTNLEPMCITRRHTESHDLWYRMTNWADVVAWNWNIKETNLRPTRWEEMSIRGQSETSSACQLIGWCQPLVLHLPHLQNLQSGWVPGPSLTYSHLLHTLKCCSHPAVMALHLLLHPCRVSGRSDAVRSLPSVWDQLPGGRQLQQLHSPCPFGSRGHL